MYVCIYLSIYLPFIYLFIYGRQPTTALTFGLPGVVLFTDPKASCLVYFLFCRS